MDRGGTTPRRTRRTTTNPTTRHQTTPSKNTHHTPDLHQHSPGHAHRRGQSDLPSDELTRQPHPRVTPLTQTTPVHPHVGRDDGPPPTGGARSHTERPYRHRRHPLSAPTDTRPPLDTRPPRHPPWIHNAQRVITTANHRRPPPHRRRPHRPARRGRPSRHQPTDAHTARCPGTVGDDGYLSPHLLSRTPHAHGLPLAMTTNRG